MTVSGFALAPGFGRERQPAANPVAAGAMRRADARVREAVELHLGLVWRVLRRAGLSPSDAEDASQDVFWILAQRCEGVAVAAQRSFLVSTALRVAADRRRSSWNRSVDVGLELEEQPSQSRALDEQLELRRAAQLLDRALARLDDSERAIYILAELEQLSRSEVASALGIPPGTVASRLRRAREAFELAVRRLRRGEPA